MISEQIFKDISSGSVIPKPSAKDEFIIKGEGKRRGERALIYYIPNHNDSTKPYEKGMTESEFEQAYQQLAKNGKFTRKWFNENMVACSKEGGCNFTTIGGIFEYLDL